MAAPLSLKSSATRIRLPNNWEPRWYQRKLWDHLEQGGKRAIAVWHRRAGKDDICLHRTAIAAHQRVGNYWHMLPEAAQARKAIWEAINPHTGIRRIDEAFPPALRETTRENEMLIRFKIGSTWQVVGSDNYNSLVGAPPIGVVFSEWSLADPAAWTYLRPIFLENDGWALFIFTPRGRNHAAKFYEAHKNNPEWFSEVLTAKQTDVFTEAQLAQELKEYQSENGEEDGEARFNQEYHCDFQAAVTGSYYGKLMKQAEDEGRICFVPYDPKLKVTTAWDLGIGDSTAIWFVQQVRNEVRVIDYYENSGVGAQHYAKVLKEKPYVYEEHILPHDAEPEVGAEAASWAGTLSGLGIRPLRILEVPNDINDGIQAGRNLLPRCRFDTEKTKRGIECLRLYRREYDDKLKTFKLRPLHDWTSHGADAFRYLAVGLPEELSAAKKREARARGPQSWMG